MATIVYLDADDEITSAASRIRGANDTRVGLVLPFGSRVATSRINFRLLAREAQANGRRLDIVAPDASARALAASAGLPVFGSVGEYEAALDADDDGDHDASDTSVVPPDLAATEAGTAGAIAGAGGRHAGVPGQADGRPIDPSRDVAPTQRVRVSAADARPADDASAAATAGRRADPRLDDRGVPDARSRRVPGRAAGIVLVAGLLLVGAGAVAAVTVLPSAEIVVTPRIEPVGPIEFTVVADPAATAVDPEAGVIPATTLQVPVSASGEFRATGKKVVRKRARGAVRFTNCDPSAAYSLEKGTEVRTRGGVAFTIDEGVFLPVAGISGSPPDIQVACTTSEVAVTAARAGEAGNVDAGTIRVVPARYDRNLVRVTNPSATSGGSREEFPRVEQGDVDAAIEQLKLDSQAQLDDALGEAGTPDGVTIFPETAMLGGLATDLDPKDLVGQEV